MADIDPAAFLWPACLLATNREARKAWKKIEKTAVQHGRWDEALEGVEMISALEHAEEIFIRTPDTRAVAWQLCAISCPDGRGACRIHQMDRLVSHRLLVSGLDHLWFALGQAEEPWWGRKNYESVIPMIIPKFANWVAPSRVVSERLVDVAVDDALGRFREYFPDVVCRLLFGLCRMANGDAEFDTHDAWSCVDAMVSVGALQIENGRYVAGPRLVQES